VGKLPIGHTAEKYDRESVVRVRVSVMAEFHRYPLRVQQSKLDGWWFIFVDEVPGLGVFGPNYEDLLDRLKVVAGNLFRARGETVNDIEIIAAAEKPALQVLH
jgi:predicted RNase H-like HicB family nuclease